MDDEVENLEEELPEIDSLDDMPQEEAEPAYEKPKHFGQEEYERKQGNKNYYKDKQKELDQEKAQARQEKESAKQQKKEANQQKKEARANRKDKENGGKESYKAAKKDAKEAKEKSKEANANYRNARSKSLGNKIDSAKSAAYRAQHPIESTVNDLKNKYNPMNRIRRKIANAKENAKQKVKDTAKKAAKKTGQAVKKGAQKVGKVAAQGAKAAGQAIGKGLVALASNPYFWVVVGVAVLVFALIMLFVAVFADDDEFTSSGLDEATVSYNINGVNSETRVQLLSSNGEVLDNINIESFSLGTALFELGTDYNEEVLKAQIIVNRTKLLSRGVTDTTANVIQVTQSDDDMVYWNYRKDMYRADQGGKYIYTPEYDPTAKPAEQTSNNSQATLIANDNKPYMEALTNEQASKAELAASEVVGRYLTDDAGNLIQINTSSVENMKKTATDNVGTENGKYSAILLKEYPSASKIEETEYEMIYYGDVGEFSKWKQKTSLGAPWGGFQLGSSSGTTINDIGCLVTSISMQIAYSGVKTGSITDFNPGTFAKAAKSQGCFSSGGAVNSYDCLSKVVPAFTLAGRTVLSGDKSNRYQTIKSYANKGYFIVIEVRKHDGGQHWVALDVQNSAAAGWGDIYIWDPATTKTKISDKKNYQTNTILYFKASK